MKAKKVELGNTGIYTSQLCFGTEHINIYTPSYGGGILADAAHLYDVNFWDTDMVYGSHPQVANGLSRVQRGQVVVCSKTYSTDKSGAKRDLARIFEELSTPYLDICLLHRVTVEASNYYPALEYLLEEKHNGRIRAVGLSTHYTSVIQEAANIPEIEIVCAPLNRDGSRIDRGSRDEMIDALQTAHQNGKGVYVIKTLGRGDLIHDLQGALEWVLQFNDFIDVYNIGFSNLSELRQDLQIINDYLYSRKETTG
jgi:aryl-alcohol dehydrogenase-like predicted oxidoreductase